MKEFEKIINDAWENKDQVNQNSDKNLKNTINQIIENLDSGRARVAENISRNTHVNDSSGNGPLFLPVTRSIIECSLCGT